MQTPGESVTDRLAETRGVLLDLDGTVYQGKQLVPGAQQAVELLESKNTPVRFGTNTTRMSRSDIIASLQEMGLRIKPDQLFTAPLAAAELLRQKGITRISLYIPEATVSDFSDFEITEDQPQAVLVGDLGRDWSFDRLNEAFRQVLNGAELMALQRNRYWRADDGLALDAGPFIAAIEYATGASATVAGKPSEAFFRAAAQSMGIPLRSMVVVGDDIQTDIAGSIRAGAAGVLVRTGKFRPEDVVGDSDHPFAIIDSVADLPGLLHLD